MVRNGAAAAVAAGTFDTVVRYTSSELLIEFHRQCSLWQRSTGGASCGYWRGRCKRAMRNLCKGEKVGGSVRWDTSWATQFYATLTNEELDNILIEG